MPKWGKDDLGIADSSQDLVKQTSVSFPAREYPPGFRLVIAWAAAYRSIGLADLVADLEGIRSTHASGAMWQHLATNERLDSAIFQQGICSVSRSSLSGSYSTMSLGSPNRRLNLPCMVNLNLAGR